MYDIVDMVSPIRADFPSAFHHITSKGDAREAIFTGNKDHAYFIEV